MIVFLLCMIAFVVEGGGSASASYYGVTVIYAIMGALFVSYCYYFMTKREALTLGSADKCLLFFECWGLLQVVLSFTGINQIFQTDLAYDTSYLARQAVYLFVLPAILLFRENLYMKGTERFLKKYGEILFWVLFVAQMFFVHDIRLMIIPQTVLCWLSLYLDTNQGWRRWIRIIAMMIVPTFDAGESTVLIIRLIFLAICILPKNWLRVGLCFLAAGVFAIVIGCFAIPKTVGDSFFSDHNMSWRVRTWNDSENVLERTYFFGAGFGTSYQSMTYVDESINRMEWQYNANSEYSRDERKFVTGPHNSFVSLAMRMGIVGIISFLIFLFLLFRDLVKHKTIIPPRAGCFALLASMMIISFNVGLENPGYLLTFVFCVGMCAREGKKLKDQNRMLQENCVTA